MEVVEQSPPETLLSTAGNNPDESISPSSTPSQSHQTRTTYKKMQHGIFNLDNFLETEQKNNKLEPWCKLDKTTKLKKLVVFTEQYTMQNNLNEEEKNILTNFFKDCLDRKKFQRVKDVIYDKEHGLIKSIPALTYSKLTKHFTLRNMDKRVSTSKSLAPKKTQTIRNKKDTEKEKEKEKEKESTSNDNDDDDEEEEQEN